MIPLQHRLQRLCTLLVGRHPFLRNHPSGATKKVLCAATSFVDDLAVMIVAKDGEPLYKVMDTVDWHVTDHFENNNIFLNKPKEESIIQLFGHGSKQELARLHTDNVHGCVPTMRYLGHRISYNGRIGDEVEIRMQATRRCYAHFGRFWE